MRKLTSTVTVKGQVRLPLEVRRLLGLAPPDRVAVVVEGHQVRIERTMSVARGTAGLLANPLPALEAEPERAAAEQAIADEAEHRPGA